MKLSRIFLFSLLASPLAAVPASQATYKPPLVPRFIAGQAFGYIATVQYQSSLRVTEFRKTMIPGDKSKDIKGTTKITDTDAEKIEENFTAELVADGAFARTIFSNGALREALFLVNRCVLTNNNDGKEQILVPKGSIIGMRVLDDGQTAFSVDGAAPEQELADRLSLLIAQLGDGRSTYDDMLGPAQPMPVGAGWPVNTNAVMRSVLTQMFPGTNQVAGSLRIEEVKTVAGAPMAVMSGVYDLGGSRPPFPAQVQSRPSLVHFRLNLTTPVAPGPGVYEYTMSADILHQGSNGDIKVGMSEARVEFKIGMEREVRFVVEGDRRPLAALVNAADVPKTTGLAKPGMTTARFFNPPPMSKVISVTAPDSLPPPLVDLDSLVQNPKPATPVPDNRPSRSYIAPPPGKTTATGVFSNAQGLNANGAIAPLPSSGNVTPTQSPNPAHPLPPLQPLNPFEDAKPISTP